MNEPRMKFQMIFEQILGREIKEDENFVRVLIDVNRKLEKILNRKIKQDEKIHETLREYNKAIQLSSEQQPTIKQNNLCGYRGNS